MNQHPSRRLRFLTAAAAIGTAVIAGTPMPALAAPPAPRSATPAAAHRPAAPPIPMIRAVRERASAPPRADACLISAARALTVQVRPVHGSAPGRGQPGSLPACRTGIAVLGAPLTAARAHTGRTFTVTMAGINLAGKPANAGQIFVINADDARRFGAASHFHHGTATFSVPAGHYWAVGAWAGPPPERAGAGAKRGGGTSTALHLVVLSQFTVTGPRTVRVDERTANSEISFATPRPAVNRLTWFVLWRGGAHGPRLLLPVLTGGPMWLSPATRRVTVGTLNTYTEGWLTSPAGATGTPYQYDLDFAGPPGTIPAQHWTPAPGSLTTVNENYYADRPATGTWDVGGGFPGQLLLGTSLSLPGVPIPIFPLGLPGRRVEYFTGGPDIGWSASYTERGEFGAGQGDGQWAGPAGPAFGTLPPGQHLNVNWNAYPLHPQPDTHPPGDVRPRNFSQQFPSAFRAGNVLTVYVTPFSDNYPGHLGTPASGRLPKTRVTGHYAIYQNGKLIAHGKPIDSSGSPRTVPTARLSAAASVIRFVYSAGRFGSRFPLSPASRTVWTWPTAPGRETTLPKTWTCFKRSGIDTPHCAVQPMMTLDYHVQGLGLDGRAPAGLQTISLDTGHIQPGPQPAVTGAAAQVSLDGGKTWQPATVTARGGGRFRVTFTAPAGSFVTLRVHATDAAGGSVTETIQRAYGTAS